MSGEVLLGDCLRFRNGAASPRRSPTGAYPVFGSNGVIGRAGVANAPGEHIVIGRVGSYCGSLHYSSHDSWVTENAIVCEAQERKGTRFWFYALQTLRLNERSAGSGQPLINQQILSGIRITLPDLDARTAIAEVLGALDDKIAANRRVAQYLDDLAAALVLRGAGSVTSALDKIASVSMGSSPRGESLNEAGEGVTFHQGIRDFGLRTPETRVFTTNPVRMAKPGDILLSVRAPVGTVNRADKPLCIGRGIAALRSMTGTPHCLFHILRGARDAWAPFNGEGTVFGSINQASLRGVLVPWAGPTDMQRLEAELAPLEERIDLNISESRHLANLRDTLLPHLMSGRITVRQAEALAEEVL